MIYPTKKGYLKYDLYKIIIPEELRTAGLIREELDLSLKKIHYDKIWSKGDMFVWCETDRKDGRFGWYTPNKSGNFNLHAYRMPRDWDKHLENI